MSPVAEQVKEEEQPRMATATIHTDERVESWLKSHGANYHPERLALESIDRERSIRNQARFEPLNDDQVDIYVQGYEQGDIFPPIVVHSTPTGYIAIDGNHRIAAVTRAGQTDIDAYVVDGASDRQVLAMTFDANVKHGLPTSVQERLKQAVNLVAMGAGQRDTAAMLNLPTARLQSEISKVRAEARLSRLGVERWDRIPTSTRGRLENIQSDLVFVEAAKLAIEAKLSSPEVSNVVTAINQKNTEAEQLGVVLDEFERRERDIKLTVGGRLPLPESIRRLNRVLSASERLAPDAFSDGSLAALSVEMRNSYRNRVQVAMQRLEGAQAELAR